MGTRWWVRFTALMLLMPAAGSATGLALRHLPRDPDPLHTAVVSAIRNSLAPGASREQVAAFVADRGWSGEWYASDTPVSRRPDWDTRPATAYRGSVVSDRPGEHRIVSFLLTVDNAGRLVRCQVSPSFRYVGWGTIPYVKVWPD